jgi:sigma-E factor negative regulatory protein RseA
MKREVSALMDGELDKKTSSALLAELHRQEEIRTCWYTYHLIGDALRKEPLEHAELHHRIIQSLQEEPSLSAPRWNSVARWNFSTPPFRIGVAAAASLAALSIVAWITMQESMVPGPAMLASVPQQAVADPAVQPANGADVEFYLRAHQEVSPALSAYRQTGPLQNVSAGQRDSSR